MDLGFPGLSTTLAEWTSIGVCNTIWPLAISIQSQRITSTIVIDNKIIFIAQNIRAKDII